MIYVTKIYDVFVTKFSVIISFRLFFMTVKLQPLWLQPSLGASMQQTQPRLIAGMSGQNPDSISHLHQCGIYSSSSILRCDL